MKVKIYYYCLLLFLTLLNLSCGQEVETNANLSQESDFPKARIALAVSDLSIGTHRLAFGIIEPGIGSIKNDAVKLETFFIQDEKIHR